MLRAVFLIARPPLLAVMQGGDYRLISIHSHDLFIGKNHGGTHGPEAIRQKAIPEAKRGAGWHRGRRDRFRQWSEPELGAGV